MGLKDIQLTPYLVTELYRNSLILNDLEQSKALPAPGTDIVFLGKNEKKIIVVTEAEDVLYLPEDSLNFLIGILNACKLSMADIGLINLASNKQLDYKKIQEQFNPDKVLLFGIEPGRLGLPLQFPHYQLQSFGGQTYIASPSLEDLLRNKQQKQLLWGSLKKLFVIE